MKPGDSVEFIEGLTEKQLPHEYGFKIVAGQRGTLKQILGTICMISPWNSAHPVMTPIRNIRLVEDK